MKWKDVQYLPVEFRSTYTPHNIPLFYDNSQYELTPEQEQLWNMCCLLSPFRLQAPELLKLCQEEMKDTVAIESLDKVDLSKYRSLVNKVQRHSLSQFVIANHRLRKVQFRNPVHPKASFVNNEIEFIVLICSHSYD